MNGRGTILPTIKYDTRQEIVSQALKEIAFARTYKQGKTKNWQINEDLYYGRKLNSETSRANVDLGRMQEFVHTLLSKIDSPLVFRFTKRKNSQLQRVNRLNALRVNDQEQDNWDIKDLVAELQKVNLTKLKDIKSKTCFWLNIYNFLTIFGIIYKKEVLLNYYEWYRTQAFH